MREVFVKGSVMDKNLSWFLKIHLQSIRICPVKWTLKQENIKYLKSLKNRLQRLNWIFQTLTVVTKLREVFVDGYLMNKNPLLFFKNSSPSSRGLHLTSITQNRKNWAEFSVIFCIPISLVNSSSRISTAPLQTWKKFVHIPWYSINFPCTKLQCLW